MAQEGWEARLARIIADQVRSNRELQRMSGQQLADRCADLGLPIHRSVIANLENGRRPLVSVAELLVLAQALKVPPILLVVPVGRKPAVEILPGLDVPTWEAAKWWRGEGTNILDLGSGPVLVSDATRRNGVDWVLRHQDLVARWDIAMTKARNEAAMAANGNAADTERAAADRAFRAHRDDARQLGEQLGELRKAMRSDELIPPPLPSGLAYIERPPVVAAIVTSAEGVLVGRRNDRTPPWTFIAGEQEPGEQAEDTAVREVKEETGLEIRAAEVIGERDHPQTGRHMIYMAARPVRGTAVFVGDEAELAEVRWASLDEADELLPGIFGPVRDYLERVLGSG